MKTYSGLNSKSLLVLGSQVTPTLKTPVDFLAVNSNRFFPVHRKESVIQSVFSRWAPVFLQKEHVIPAAVAWEVAVIRDPVATAGEAATAEEGAVGAAAEEEGAVGAAATAEAEAEGAEGGSHQFTLHICLLLRHSETENGADLAVKSNLP